MTYAWQHGKYDAIGQLIRVNDPTDPRGGANGTTWLMTYDLGGNLLTKDGYAYTTGTVGSIVQQAHYAYGNSAWKDQLTGINGATHAYDSIGNILTDGNWTYQWQHGKQLRQMTKADGTTVTFEYNEDGLRTKKTSTSLGETIYTLHGKNVVHMTQGGHDLHF